MPHILKNKVIEVHIDLPFENYNFSRFDWTGKISKVKFNDIPVSVIERTDCENEHHFGKGFYNEFGIDAALGFEEAEIGGWFHKIGVGLLRKEDDQYLFSKPYEIKPAEFEIISGPDRIQINCQSQAVAGYSYLLKKEITIHERGFTIKYHLRNTGEKDIITDEYVHNFTAINKALIGVDYILRFPFPLMPERFGASVNPEQKVEVGKNEIKFKGSPKEQFFFSHLSGNEDVDARWELIHVKNKIGLRETGSFQTNKVNLWGWEHVISPELFFNIFIEPGQATEWSRTYEVFEAGAIN